MVTIILAAYNGEKYIGDLLSSIEKQTYKDWSLLASDDLSGDSTLQILGDFSESHPGQVRVIERTERAGSAKENFFYLLSEVDDDYIMFCDQDDVWLPEKIEKTLAVMKATEKSPSRPALVHTDITVVDGELNEIASSMFKYQGLDTAASVSKLLIQNNVTGCTTMINRALKNLLIKAPSHEDIRMHDHWASLYAAIFGDTGFLPESTILYRQHGDNSIGAKGLVSLASLKRILEEGKAGQIEKLHANIRQAALLYSLEKDSPDLKPEYKKLIRGFISLAHAGKTERAAFYIKKRCSYHYKNKRG